MIPILSCLLVLIVAYLFAQEEAKQDAWLIREGMRIDHAVAWCFRAAVMVLVVLLLLTVVEPWHAIPLLAISGFAFSAFFRYRLNALRGKDWRYIGPWSSWYDSLFYRLYMCGYALFRLGVWIWPNDDMIDTAQWGFIRGTTATTQDIHRSGILAYTVESLISIACLVWLAARSI